MANPNNCATCQYKQINSNREGHCYMFEHEPTEVCRVHTGRNTPVQLAGELIAACMRGEVK